MPRKRFNAFDDFPVEHPSDDEWQQEEENRAPEAPAGAPAANSLFTRPGGLSEAEVQQVERIERLKPSEMIPDRFQPRRLLPTALRQPFYSGQIDAYQAAHQWLQMSRTDEGIQKQVEGLLNMGLSFGEHGQIKPITGSWVEMQDGNYIFQIETGERRFWAACLQYVANGKKVEPLLRVEVVAEPTRMRQVLENRHAEPPSAVGQACEVASLILAELDIAPQGDEKDEFDYFRLANAKRMPPGLWDKIIPIMNVSRPRLAQLLNILSLPTPLLDLADRYRLPERVLREVLSAPRERWESLVRASIQNNLTSDDVADLAEKPRDTAKATRRNATPPDPAQMAINALKRFTYSIETLDDETQFAVLDEIASDLVISDRGEAMVSLLRELAERIRIRQQNKSRRW